MLLFQLLYTLVWYVVICLVCKISIRSSPALCMIGVLLAQLICLVILFSLLSVPRIETFLLNFDPYHIIREDLPYMGFFFVSVGIIPALIASAILKLGLAFEKRKQQ